LPEASEADITGSPHMSAFGGKADMAFCGISLSRWAHFDKKRCFVIANTAGVGICDSQHCEA
jgi:hypothetical protein